MPWIARDKDKPPLYRLFGEKPVKAKMVNYDGEVQEDFTWTLPKKPYVDMDDYNKKKEITYKPFDNSENTTINETDCPIYLEPGEGPIEVNLVLKNPAPQRNFEGEGI